MEENMQIRQRIIEYANSINMTQKELLEKAKLNSQLMQKMKKSGLLASNLKKIADILDVSTDYLLGRTDNPKSHKVASKTDTPNTM